MSAEQDRQLKVSLGYDNTRAAGHSGHYKNPEQEGWKRIRLERATDALHDLELRINVRHGRAIVDLNDGILRAASVTCVPSSLRVDRIYHVYVLFAGDATFDLTEQAAVKLHDWLADTLIGQPAANDLTGGA